MMNHRSRLMLSLAIVLCAAPHIWSQESRGTILGRVTDSSDALIPGVTIQIVNVATNVVTRVTTNSEGRYISSFLNPGSYRITAEKEGFKRLVREGIGVNVNARVELDLALEIGAVAETLTVTAETPLLETTNASLGRVVEVEEARSLPLNHGNTDNLIRLSGNVAFTDEPAKDQPWQALNTAYAMSGSRASSSEFTLDGASNTARDVNRGAIAQAWTPIGEAVAEFKVQTATFDAMTGQTEGGVINVSLKSGTNQLHGGFFWGKQTPEMNANQWFANRAGVPRADLNYNRLGGTVSGPVVLPKLYDGRNKTFFMLAYQHINSVAVGGTAAGLVATVPTAAQREGDFSALLKLGNNYQIYDPFTRTPTSGGRFTNQPLPGNIIPSSRISPVAKNILSYYPLPEQAGTADGGNNLDRTNGAPSRVEYHSLVYKFDHNLGSKDRFMFRINTSRNDNLSVYYFGIDNPSLGAHFWQEGAGFAFSHNHSFTPTLFMDFRVSDSAWVRAQDAHDAGLDFQVTKLGLPASLQSAIAPPYQRFPWVTINGYTGLGSRVPLHRMLETRSAALSLFKLSGKHELKFGSEFRFYPQNESAGSATTATQLTFSESYTRGPLDNSPVAPRGQALAAMMFGIPAGGGLTLPSANDFAESSKMWAFFFQDDIKLTRKLTLNLGLRYEYETAVTERYNRAVRGFDPAAVQPFEAQALANYAKSPTPEVPVGQFSVKGGLTFAGVNGLPQSGYSPDGNNFMPRVGFAYSMDSKTVIRGGFGMYFGSMGIRRFTVTQSGFSRTTDVVASKDGGVSFSASLANPFPEGLLQPKGAADGAATNVGNNNSYFEEKPRAAGLSKWSVDIQRELPARFAVSVGYMGSTGSDLEVTRSLRGVPNQYLSTSPARDQAKIDYMSANLPSPFAGLAEFKGTSMASSVISRANLIAPFPQYSGLSGYTYDGTSSYNVLNARLEKRFSGGYLFNVVYAWSKFMESTSLLNAADAVPAKVISNQDYPHHLALSAVYDLPFGRGRRFASDAGRFWQAVIGNWKTSFIYTYQSGRAIDFGNVILLGDVHDVPLPADQRTAERYFNTTMFNRVPAQQLGSNVRTLSQRFNGIRSGVYDSWDASLQKNFVIRESLRVELRCDAMNALNQVTMDLPNTTPTSTTFGTVTAQKNVPRSLQLTLRVEF